jgi:hypothetical protein
MQTETLDVSMEKGTTALNTGNMGATTTLTINPVVAVDAASIIMW